jgi:hypothetical protein
MTGALVGLYRSTNSSAAPSTPRERIWLMSRWSMGQGAPLLDDAEEALLLDDAEEELLLDDAETLLDDPALLLDDPPPPGLPIWKSGYPQPAASTGAMTAARSLGNLFISRASIHGTVAPVTVIRAPSRARADSGAWWGAVVRRSWPA